MLLKLPVDITKIQSPEIRKFLQKLELKVFFEIDETDTTFRLTDDYLVHENAELSSLPLIFSKKNQKITF